jgi:hypothetical protein
MIKTAAIRLTFTPGFGNRIEESIANEKMMITGRIYTISGLRNEADTRTIALAEVGRPRKNWFCLKREKDERRMMLQIKENTSTIPRSRWKYS